MKKVAGFTLIELLIVVAIIAILAAIAVPNFLEAQVRSKVSRVHADMRSIATAIEAYVVDHNVPPIAQGTNTGAGSFKRFSYPLYFYTDRLEECGGFLTLTTPIAYMSSFPEDPFLLEWTLENNYYQLPQARNISFYFINFVGGYKHVAGGGSWISDSGAAAYLRANGAPVESRFNGGGNPGFISWMLFSPGPDREGKDPSNPNVTHMDIIDPAQMLQRGNNLLSLRDGGIDIYDATNGTTSVGQIIRTSGGIPGK